MPSYKVLERGFHDGRLYDPKGKRRTLHVDKPFPKGKEPSWLEPIKAESAAEKRKRQATGKADQAKAASDQKDINELSFMGEGESAGVETL